MQSVPFGFHSSAVELSVCDLIIDPPSPAAWNMAVDELLLARAADGGVAALRFYRWYEPTLSLGYFQNYADREQHAASRTCAVVRRQSGGGAILHDRELTYSIALPSIHPLARRSEELYRRVHEAIIEVLQPRLASPSSGSLKVSEGKRVPPNHEPFLCFQRRSAGDVTWNPGNEEEEIKVVGSAQRRRRGAILQHGSILLESSPAAPELPGLRDRSGLTMTVNELATALAAPLAKLLGVLLVPASRAIESAAKVEQLAAEKYGSPTWTKRR